MTAGMEEGVIKYRLDYTSGPPLPMTDLDQLNQWRNILWQHALIGQDPARYEGYGFGNVSQRTGETVAARGRRSFIISGTQTGHLAELDGRHYTQVICYDPATNYVQAAGPVRPSSESLTHGMIYDLDSKIRVVLHAHSADIWLAAENLGIPVTDAAVPYGTPEMATEVERLFSETGVREKKIFSMGGHQDGIVAFGTTPAEAGNILLQALAESGNPMIPGRQ